LKRACARPAEALAHLTAKEHQDEQDREDEGHTGRRDAKRHRAGARSYE
jgi:hypothetical protein